MSGILITWPQLLYVGLILILFYVAELVLFLRKSSQSKTGDPYVRKSLAEHREQVVELRREIESIKVRLAAMFMQQQAQETTIRPDASPTLAEDSPYSRAIRMAQLGEDAEKVSAQCGVSRGEADLIVALYRTGTSR